MTESASRRDKVIAGAAVSLALVGVAYFGLGRPRPPVEIPIDTHPIAAQSSADEVVVHVIGAVARPGVVRIASTARVQDAIVAAGGALPDADLQGVNLAAVVVDGQQIRVPTIAPPPIASTSPSTPAPEAAPHSPIRLNQASAEELERLPGIGPEMARRIVDFRTQNGPFRTLDDLLAVPGIGPATLEEIKPFLTL